MNEVVYFIQAKNGGPIKIGRAINPNKRLITLQISHHDELEIIGIDQHGNESDYHAKFSIHHIRGEWFRPHADILNEIAGLKVKTPTGKKKRHPAHFSKIRALIEKGTLRCQWCHIRINEDTGTCPQCHRDVCYISWYDVNNKKTVRIFSDSNGMQFNYNAALSKLIEINREYILAKELKQLRRFDIIKYVSKNAEAEQKSL